MIAMSIRTAVRLLLFLVLFSMPLSAQDNRRLWVLQPPGAISEYNPDTFRQINSHKVPSQVFQEPGSLSINRIGQMLFAPRTNAYASPKGKRAANHKLWLWNGGKTSLLDRNVRDAGSKSGIRQTIVEVTPQSFLSVQGHKLYWFENEFEKGKEGTGPEISVSTISRFWQTDMDGGDRKLLAEYSFPTCACGTGVCSETCPEADVWAPNDGIDDYILVTHWIPGQIGSDYLSSFLYARNDAHWSIQKLDHPIEIILDAAQRGTAIVEALEDSGCCGWDNESNDQTFLSNNGERLVLFDERRRYANRNYDISFFTSMAKLSPGLRMVAMTIVSSAHSGMDIRLSDGGIADMEELERIRKAAADFPAVEVLGLADSPTRVLFIPQATLVGWLNDDRILIIEDKRLVAFDVSTGNRNESPIDAAETSHVFIR